MPKKLNSKKEDFLGMLREMNVYIKKDVTVKIKSSNKEILEDTAEEIVPKKKVFKPENFLNKLKEAHYGKN
jgi:hypothetical protein